MNEDIKNSLNRFEEELTPNEIHSYWQESLNGSILAYDKLKEYYKKKLFRIRPLYANLDEPTFLDILEKSTSKALERGLKFKVENYESYMNTASQTYFKYHLLPDSDSLHIPADLMKAYAKLDQVYNHIPALETIDEQEQIKLLSKGFEYPDFSTRLLFYSFRKWKDNQLRQVDIDLTVNLLPLPQRVEWEVFYEKDMNEIENTIKKEFGK